MLSKLKSIFLIVAILDMMQYEFENGAVVKIPEKPVIAVANLLLYYLIIVVDYANPFLVSKLIVLCNRFKVFGKTSFANDNPVKLGK